MTRNRKIQMEEEDRTSIKNAVTYKTQKIKKKRKVDGKNE